MYDENMSQIVAITNLHLCYEYHPEYELLKEWGHYEELLRDMDTAERKMCTALLIQLEKLAQMKDIEFIVLREKDLELGNYLVLANEAMKICSRYNKELVVHYYYEAACMSCRVINENSLSEKKIKNQGIRHSNDSNLHEIMKKHESELDIYLQNIRQHNSDEIVSENFKLGLHLPLWKFKELVKEFNSDAENTYCKGCIGGSQMLATGRRLGVSVHSISEALEAELLGATYLIAGNIYETDCKKGLPGKGLEYLRDVCAAVSIPVYAIGGITKDRLSEIKQAGAAGGCMMSGMMRLHFTS
jgi:thiamine-phosphate pyrophosphorylase